MYIKNDVIAIAGGLVVSQIHSDRRWGVSIGDHVFITRKEIQKKALDGATIQDMHCQIQRRKQKRIRYYPAYVVASHQGRGGNPRNNLDYFVLGKASAQGIIARSTVKRISTVPANNRIITGTAL